MTKEILSRYLNNQCTEHELAEVLRWVNSETFDKEGIKLLSEDWINYLVEKDVIDDERFTSLFDKIQIKIDNDQQAEKVFNNKASTFTIVTRWFMRAAAVLIIPVLAILSYTILENKSLSTQYTDFSVDSLEIIAPVGSRTVVQLSDGSKVHLNYGSKLKYPQFFSGETREIFLEGEGFFEVAHHAEKPFIVRTKGLNIKALGTSFNVMAYPDNFLVRTTLVDGSVVLEQKGTTDDIKTIGSMVPGQHVEYNTQTGAIFSTIGDTYKYISWKEGKIIFEDTPLKEIAEKLNRMFNVEIQIDKEIEGYIYTFVLMDDHLSQILDLIAIATPIQYRTLTRKKMQDGTYSKQRIVITKIKS